MSEPSDTKTTQARPAFDPEAGIPTPLPVTSPGAPLSSDAERILNAIAGLQATIETVDTARREDARGLRVMITDTADRDTAAHQHTRRHIRRLSGMSMHMWRQLNGSKPPPPPTPGSGEHLAFSGFTPAEQSATEKQSAAWDREITDETPEGGIPIATAADNARTKARAMAEIVEESERALAENARKITDTGLESAAAIGRILGEMATKSEVAEVREILKENLDLQKEQMGKQDRPENRGLGTRIFDTLLYALREREGQRFALTLLGTIGGIITATATIIALIANIAHGRPITAPPPAIQAPYQQNDMGPSPPGSP